MTIKTKIVKTKYVFAFTLSFLIACSSVLGGKEVDKRLSKIRDLLFIYPSNVFDYSVSGSSLIEFNISSNDEVENLHIIESLGIPFDNSIIDGLGQYVSSEVISKNGNIKNQYRLKVKFEN